MILDDPLQAGDDEHRPTFIAYVLGKLIEDDVQVIVLTHDGRTSKQIHHLHERLPVVGFALSLDKPFEGTTVTRTTNTAEALLQRAKVYLDSDDAQLRGSAATKLREAAERIAKEIIVKSRNATGESCSLAEYDGVTLGLLIRQITPYLTQADHPGKWTVIGDWLNPGTRDDTPPPKNELKMAFGYLREFVKVYLRGSPVSVAT
ncbi:MAG: hypothetical protein H0W90_08890 [Actinobacteria bacterium]|nr:hypothetical protein [Actinomycetota bacterium]